MEIWQSELGKSVRTLEQLSVLRPTEDVERLRPVVKGMRISITPHSLRLVDWADPWDPILLQCLPSTRELRVLDEELSDPIGDEVKSPIPFLTHRYTDRVLVFPTFFCSLYCRFCFRREKTGIGSAGPKAADLDRIVEYLTQHLEVKEVILTGGDPLTLTDKVLATWLARLTAVDSVIKIRIHTRVLVNLPSRVTNGLLEVFQQVLDSGRALTVVSHFNHPKEIAEENVVALGRLARLGVVLKNQGPLLRRVNDSLEVLAALYRRLSAIGVEPYYLHQLDLAKGTNHFRVPIEKGLALIRQLRTLHPDLTIPKYVLDLPGGNGKVPVESLTKIDSRTWEGVGLSGERVRYTEPK